MLVSFLTAFKRPTECARLFSTARDIAANAIATNQVMVFSKTYCPHCKRAKEAISALPQKFGVMELDVEAQGAEIQAALLDMTGQKTVPNIFVNNTHVGGCDKTLAAIASGEFNKLLSSK